MTNFLDLEDIPYDTSNIVIFSVPYDGTSTYVKGADKGPQAIIAASAHVEIYDIETKTEVWREGIHTLAPLAVNNDDTPETVVQKVQESVSQFISDGKFVVMLGGEHSISSGMANALFAKYPNMSVLHLDAHADTREEYDGNKHNHACVMARIRELGVPIVQVGIRSVDAEEIASKKDNQHIYWAHEIHDAMVAGNSDEWMDDALSHLTETVFVTIDLDVFDPSIMPSTGTPEPGGLGWYQVNRFLEKVCASRRIVGFDVVELAPNDSHKAPDFMTAKLVYRLLSMVFSR
jgi:agmatinase